MFRPACAIVLLSYAVILCGDFNIISVAAQFFGGLGHGYGHGIHGHGGGHGLGYHFPHFINYSAVFEIKCIKKGGVCVFIDDCDIEMNVYFKTCGYNKSVVCCVPREIICKLSYGICSENREGCTSAGFFWSWFQCNTTHRCCRPHKFKKKKKKKKKKKRISYHDDHDDGYGYKKKKKKKKKKKMSFYGGYGDHHDDHHGYGHDYHDDDHGHGYDHHDDHDYHHDDHDYHDDDHHGGGYGGFLDFIK